MYYIYTNIYIYTHKHLEKTNSFTKHIIISYISHIMGKIIPTDTSSGYERVMKTFGVT